MRKKHILFVTLVFVFACNLYSQRNNKPEVRCEYLLYLPADYSNRNDSLPLIIYLHGASHRGKDLNKLKGYGLPYLIDQGNEYDFIIASPQCPENTYWSGMNWFDPLYQDLTGNYRIDTDRVYVTGMSMGGYGTWQAAVDFPEKIAAIVPLCGGCNDSLNICQIMQIPVWTFHGTADKAIEINETERLVKRLMECDGNVKFTRLENEGHGIQYIYEMNPEIYEWMLEYKK